MIYMWFTGLNYCKLAVEKDRDYFYDHETRLNMGVNGCRKIRRNAHLYFVHHLYVLANVSKNIWVSE
jgi:hypothetical protein